MPPPEVLIYLWLKRKVGSRHMSRDRLFVALEISTSYYPREEKQCLNITKIHKLDQ